MIRGVGDEHGERGLSIQSPSLLHSKGQCTSQPVWWRTRCAVS
ncbi:hypothetical protein HanPSC8_Chr16g0719341 [Helianthus annuus]|nr:hypothetical protein HanPSC8_Chr16g0719341 [Helianthus annuus]